MNQLTVETDDTFATLLELAANNDVNGFTNLIKHDPSSIDDVGLWYGRQKGSKQMVLEHRTPLMVASMYGSIDVLNLILSLSKSDVNRSTGVDKTTALHCAAASGSPNAVDVIKLLLSEGADPNLIDVNGLRPVDMIVVSPKFPNTKNTLEELLGNDNESVIKSDDNLVSSPKISNLNDGSPSSFTPPMSPSATGVSNWQQPNVPSLLLPGSNLQSSRLRSSLNARDMNSDHDLNMFLQMSGHNQTMLTPTKLDDIFATETSSPRFSDQSMFSPRNNNSSVFNQFQQQQNMLSPINTNFSKNGPFAVQSMSPRSMEAVSPMGSRVSNLARENQHQQQLRSLSSRELGSNLGSSVDQWSKWGSSSGKADWAVNADEFGKLRRSSSFGEEPDLSWVQSLVKEPGGSGPRPGHNGSNSNTEMEQMDPSVLSAWIEQMQLDQLVAQQN
ncbi:hypothetical protein L1887_22561 [Cichorium endivia]|nr:hypothetical protein L1887_22561 [Cichorium endivia]